MVDAGGACAPAQHRAVSRWTTLWPEAGPGTLAELVTVPSRQGLEALDILRLRTGIGPVLHDPHSDTLGFVVPPGTAARWNLPGTVCRPLQHGVSGRRTAHAPTPPVQDSSWLVAPGAGVLPATPPGALCAAFREAGRVLAALDRCCR